MLPRVLFALFCLFTYSHADTLTVDSTLSEDTCLFEYLPGYNWGAEPELVAGVLDSPAGGDDRCRIFDLFCSDSHRT